VEGVGIGFCSAGPSPCDNDDVPEDALEGTATDEFSIPGAEGCGGINEEMTSLEAGGLATGDAFGAMDVWSTFDGSLAVDARGDVDDADEDLNCRAIGA